MRRERELEEARSATRALQHDLQKNRRPSSCSSGDSTPKTPANSKSCEGDKRIGLSNSYRRRSPSRMCLVGGMVAAPRSQPSSFGTESQLAQVRSNDDKLNSRMHRTLDMTGTFKLNLRQASHINEGSGDMPEKTVASREYEKDDTVASDGLSLEERYINEISRLENTPPPSQVDWSDLTRNPYDSGNGSALELSCDSWQRMTDIRPEQYDSTLALSMSLSGDLSVLVGVQPAF